MTVEDPGLGAAALASLAEGEERSLAALAEEAVRQVPGCSAAVALLWRTGELAAMAATHPDAAAVAELEFAADHVRAGSPAAMTGPLTAALRGGAVVSCADTLTESRWPAWADAALRRGVRSAVCLTGQFPGDGEQVLLLALIGVRPGALDTDAVGTAEALARFGGTALASTLAYDEARRTATQLQDSVAARALTDQAKGILMHALGCDADAALGYLRTESQRRHVKVTEIAARVIEAHTGGDSARRSRPREPGE